MITSRDKIVSNHPKHLRQRMAYRREQAIKDRERAARIQLSRLRHKAAAVLANEVWHGKGETETTASHPRVS